MSDARLQPRSGEKLAEAGGVAVTLIAWCHSHGKTLEAVTAAEVDRIEKLDREKVREKQRSKFRDGFGIDVEETKP
jgi:hypothetical protein